MTICIYKGDLIEYEMGLGYFLFFWLQGSWTRVQNSWIFQKPEILRNRCNFTLRWLLDLGSTSLDQNLRLKALGYLLFIPAIFFICCLTAPWPTFDCYRANSFTHPMLIAAFGLSVFGPELKWEDWVSASNWAPSELWSQDHNTPNCRKYSAQT